MGRVFLNGVLGDDAFDASSADDETGLTQFLSNHLGRGLGVEEAMPNDLPHQFVGASIVPLGTARLALKRCRPLLLECPANLEVPLLAEAVLLCSLAGPEPFKISFDEHRQLLRHFVVVGDRQGTKLTNQLFRLGIELHLQPPTAEREQRAPPARL
jgi:hypothetical protein